MSQRDTIHPDRLRYLDALIKEYRLDLHLPGVIQELSMIDLKNPRPIHLKMLLDIEQRVASFAQYHSTLNPFVVAPASILQGDIILARQKADNTLIKIPILALSQNVLAVASTGGGKTNFVQHLLYQILQHKDIKALVADFKDDSRRMAYYNDFLVLHPEAKYNILQKPSFMGLDEHFATIVSVFSRTTWGGEHVKQILFSTLKTIFSENSNPCLADLRRAVNQLYRRADTFSYKDAIRGVSLRLDRIKCLYPGLFLTRASISTEELFQHSILLSFIQMDEISSFLSTLLITQEFLHNRKKGIRNCLRYVNLFDEGLLTWGSSVNTIEKTAPLSSLISMTREWGTGNIITTVNYAKLEPSLLSNVNTQVVMSLTSGKEIDEIARSFSLSPAQKTYLATKISLGEAIIKANGEWKLPMLATYPPLAFSKSVSLAEWEEAKGRIDLLAPVEQAPLELSPQKDAEGKKQKNQVQEPENAPAIASEEEGLEPAPKMTDVELQLLKYISENLVPSTEVYRALNLHPQTATNIRKKLLTLELIKEEQIFVRSGRGNTAKILMPTEKAEHLFKLKKAAGTKGGDTVQHRYLVQGIAKLIEKSSVEQKIGDKNVDILIVFNPSIHQNLVQAIKAQIANDKESPIGIIFYIDENFFKEKAYIAIEVEISDPKRSAPANASKNAANGVALTVEVCLPGQLASAAKALAGAPKTVLIDVLRFLDALRAGNANNRLS